jgi:hypothetical protein
MTFPIPKDTEELRVHVDGKVVETALTVLSENQEKILERGK